MICLLTENLMHMKFRFKVKITFYSNSFHLLLTILIIIIFFIARFPLNNYEGNDVN